MTDKIWAHSGDSHLLEPDDLWHQIMPKAQADRMPRTERISDNEERVTVDGKSFTRPLPKIMTAQGRDRRDDRRDLAPSARVARPQAAHAGPRRRRASGPR